MGRAFEVRKRSMAKTAQAKARVYSKYGKELYMAAKGNPNPEVNMDLKRIIEKAKKDEVPNHVIKNAIDKAKGGGEENYSEIIYEGFGPGGSMFIVECLTDNVNRTYSMVRNCFTKSEGKVGVNGSVTHMFSRQSVFAVKNMNEEEALDMIVEHDIDAEDIESDDNGVSIFGNVSDYSTIREAIKASKEDVELVTDEIMWLPMVEVDLTTTDDIKNFEKLTSMLDEVEDVKEVYHNVKN